MSEYSLNISKIGMMYRLNNSGPRTEPWDTTCVIRRGGERWPLMRTDDVRLVMNDSIHLSALSLIPICTSRWIRIVWSNVCVKCSRHVE